MPCPVLSFFRSSRLLPTYTLLLLMLLLLLFMLLLLFDANSAPTLTTLLYFHWGCRRGGERAPFGGRPS